eukprot:2952833-Amphidinium_carterae.1
MTCVACRSVERANDFAVKVLRPRPFRIFGVLVGVACSESSRPRLASRRGVSIRVSMRRAGSARGKVDVEV